jgi:serine protease Do
MKPPFEPDRHPALRATALAAALAWPLLLGTLACPLPAWAQTAPAAVPAAGLPDFSALVEAVGPAVVNIRAISSARAGRSPARPGADAGPESREDLLRRYFGQPGQPGAPAERPAPRGVGSGFVIDADGWLLTNAHVIEDAAEVLVRLTDQREFKARVVGTDQRTDVALLKIDARGLPALKLGDVSRLKVGEWVIAIGSPFDLDNTVTAGIVSAKGRDTGELLPFIQTDVAINPGNSGGPLINLRGEVVGINSQIYSRSGGYMGISFAIPIDEAGRISEQLRASGRVIRGRIGVQTGEVTRALAASLGLAQAAGALVRGVEVDGPAAQAGIEPGDVITAFDGQPVLKPGDLPRLVGASAPGSRKPLALLRAGRATTLTVTVAELDAERMAAAPRAADEAAAAGTDALAGFGLTLTELAPAERLARQLDRGVRVVGVTGLAARAGLQEGDILLSVANTEIRAGAQLNALLGKLDPRRPFSVLLRRGEWTQYLLVPPRA